jgi:hypothetical protein
VREDETKIILGCRFVKTKIKLIWKQSVEISRLGSFHKLHLHFLAFFDHERPSLHFLCIKLRAFLTTYPPLIANIICESSLKISFPQIRFKYQYGSIWHPGKPGIPSPRMINFWDIEKFSFMLMYQIKCILVLAECRVSEMVSWHMSSGKPKRFPMSFGDKPN